MLMHLMTLMVHKLRRGPCGTGKMWGELCEAMELLLKYPARNNDLISRYSEAILNDRGRPTESGMTAVLSALAEMLAEGKGPVVQMRRWFTIYDAARRLQLTPCYKP